jgi:hypothetical protein
LASHWEDTIGEFPFQHPSVFSYYLPDFKPDNFPDGMVAPEFQVFTSTQIISALQRRQILWAINGNYS